MNYYSKAIEILNSDQDWKQICVQIAKKHPKYLVDAQANVDIDWPKQLEGMSKIAAIKLVRDIKKNSLKDAKEFVEYIQRTAGFEWS